MQMKFLTRLLFICTFIGLNGQVSRPKPTVMGQQVLEQGKSLNALPLDEKETSLQYQVEATSASVEHKQPRWRVRSLARAPLPEMLPPSLVSEASQPAAAHTTCGSSVMGSPAVVEAEPRTSLNRSVPSHRSETIGSENSRANAPSVTPETMLSRGGSPSVDGINSVDCYDERGSTGEQGCRARVHVSNPPDSQSRMDRDRGK